jgi:hypothetical protein
VLLCATFCLMPALLPKGDESAMNLVGLGVLFRHIYCSLQHFCVLGPKKLRQSGPMRLTRGGAIILVIGIIGFLCTAGYETPLACT